MYSRIRSYLAYGNKFCSLEITTDEDGRDQFNIVIARKNNDEFEKLEFQNTNDLTELPDIISKNQHCEVIINTDAGTY